MADRKRAMIVTAAGNYVAEGNATEVYRAIGGDGRVRCVSGPGVELPLGGQGSLEVIFIPPNVVAIVDTDA
jgi:hypothetical protein